MEAKKLSPEKMLILHSLGEVVAEKRRILQGIGMMNANTDEVTRMQQSLDYSQAQSALHRAQDALANALSKAMREEP